MKEYDVIIIGAGPAGSAAAKVLSQSDLKYAVIDKAKFPRDKLCGGGLTYKSTKKLNTLGLKFSDISNKKEDKVRLMAKRVDRIMPLYNSIYMIDRNEFDFNNIKQGTKNNFYDNQKIISISNNIITTNKNKFKYKYLIYADGVNGLSRKLISIRKFGFCLEYTVDKELKDTIFDFSAIPNGYGWVFPKIGHTVIGVGAFNTKKYDYIKYLLEFAKNNNIDIDKSKIKGFPIPLFDENIYKNSVINNNQIIVGDAASLVDSISGEGIYYALSSGKAAAESIINAIKENKDLKEEYFNKTKDIIILLKKSKTLSKLLYSKMGIFFIRLGLSNKHLIKKIHNLFG